MHARCHTTGVRMIARYAHTCVRSRTAVKLTSSQHCLSHTAIPYQLSESINPFLIQSRTFSTPSTQPTPADNTSSSYSHAPSSSEPLHQSPVPSLTAFARSSSVRRCPLPSPPVVTIPSDRLDRLLWDMEVPNKTGGFSKHVLSHFEKPDALDLITQVECTYRQQAQLRKDEGLAPHNYLSTKRYSRLLLAYRDVHRRAQYSIPSSTTPIPASSLAERLQLIQSQQRIMAELIDIMQISTPIQLETNPYATSAFTIEHIQKLLVDSVQVAAEVIESAQSAASQPSSPSPPSSAPLPVALTHHSFSQLIATYHNSTYTCYPPGVAAVHCRVGPRHLNPILDELIQFQLAKQSTPLPLTATYLTAWNPWSSEDSAEANQQSNQQLESDLMSLGLPYLPSSSKADLGQMKEEKGFCVFGLTHIQAQELALKYRQNAIVYCDEGKPAEVIWTGVHPSPLSNEEHLELLTHINDITQCWAHITANLTVVMDGRANAQALAQSNVLSQIPAPDLILTSAFMTNYLHLLLLNQSYTRIQSMFEQGYFSCQFLLPKLNGFNRAAGLAKLSFLSQQPSKRDDVLRNKVCLNRLYLLILHATRCGFFSIAAGLEELFKFTLGDARLSARSLEDSKRYPIKYARSFLLDPSWIDQHKKDYMTLRKRGIAPLARQVSYGFLARESEYTARTKQSAVQPTGTYLPRAEAIEAFVWANPLEELWPQPNRATTTSDTSPAAIPDSISPINPASTISINDTSASGSFSKFLSQRAVKNQPLPEVDISTNSELTNKQTRGRAKPSR